MKKLKYGLLLILSMILFSVPTLAAKTTYYLPSKVVIGSANNYNTYAYDKYGHVIEYYDTEEDCKITWKYKYDKNGKRISGEQYLDGYLVYKLTFDKNDRLKTKKSASGAGETIKFKWNAKGYSEGNPSFEFTYKYAYYKNGNVKKIAMYYNGKCFEVEYFDNSGLRSKNPPARDGYKETYEYVLDKNGLVKTKIVTSIDRSGQTSKTTIKYYYSKTKTDAKTYYLFIDGWDYCEKNGKL